MVSLSLLCYLSHFALSWNLGLTNNIFTRRDGESCPQEKEQQRLFRTAHIAARQQ
jgi:hypothetical protein